MPNDDKKPHVAIIMDGNGRWAETRGLPRVRGHHAGAEAVDRTAEAAVTAGVGTLTLYAFSTENWKRPPAEVRALMSLLRVFLRRKRKKLLKNGVRLRWLGRRDRIPRDAAKLFTEIEDETAHLDKMTLVLAVDYGGRWELMQAAEKFAARRRRHGRSTAAGGRPPRERDDGNGTAPEASEEEFAACLPTPWLPNVDLLVRTAGERRLSNFLPWHTAYAELYFTSVMWPDFGEEELRRALSWYARRLRRYGGLPETAARTPS